MILGLLGKGKTGSKVIELCEEKNIELKIFDSKNRPNLELLKAVDIVISFLPGPAFESYLELLIESKTPVVTGSTGFQWPQGYDEFSSRLEKNQNIWVHGNNFSLGMNIIKKMIETLSLAEQLFDSDQIKTSIHEVHHTKKLDAPSGTALAWSQWLRMPAKITSKRTGDVIGDHTLSFETPFEKISLRHEALDRKIFASGALWIAQKLANKKIKLVHGLHTFQDIVQDEFLK